MKTSNDEVPTSIIIAPIQSELSNFFDKLSKCGTKPAILFIVNPNSNNYAPKVVLPLFPKLLQQVS